MPQDDKTYLKGKLAAWENFLKDTFYKFRNWEMKIWTSQIGTIKWELLKRVSQ